MVQLPWYMHKFGNIVMVKLKIGRFKQMFDITNISGNQVVHSNDLKLLLDKTISKVRAQETGHPRNQYPLSMCLFHEFIECI